MPYQGRSPQTGVRNRFVYTATASQTLFSGADSNGRTLRYEDGAYVDVFLNGVCLVPTSDFTATTKTSITLVSGAAASDVVEIVCYDIASMADTVSKSQGGTFDGSITVNGSFSADGGTIKLDGNYPTGTANVALGDTALDSLTSGGYNTAIGPLSLTANTSGSSNNALGWAALGANTTGFSNTAVGHATLGANTTGSYNTAYGQNSLNSNTTASNNTAVGYQAGYSNTTGVITAIGALAGKNYNTSGTETWGSTFVGLSSGDTTTTGVNNAALGGYSLRLNTTGSQNVALGAAALYSNTTASNNTAVGYQAAYSSTSGAVTAVGYRALYSNTAATANGAFGFNALQANTTGIRNEAHGTESLESNTTGSYNTALGAQALRTNTTASYNTAVGYQAGYAYNGALGSNTYVGFQAGQNSTEDSNTFVGARVISSGKGCGQDMTTGAKNTILGAYSGNQGGLDIRTSSNRIVLSDGDGNIGLYIDNGGNIRNRNYISALQGIEIENLAYGRINFYKNGTAGTYTACSFYNNVSAQVGTIVYSDSATGYNTSSDYRLKEDVQPMVNPTDRLLALNPVNFAWKSNGSRVDGFLAHEVQAIVPEAITGTKDEVDADGNPVYQGIDQSKLVPLLVATIKELEARITALENA